MKLTDKKAIDLLKKVRHYELEEDIDGYPSEEVDVSDMQFLADETSYLLERYRAGEESLIWGASLVEAKRILRETRYGKSVPLIIDDRQRRIYPKYADWEIEDAKKTVNRYNRLERLYKKLCDMGYYGKWL